MNAWTILQIHGIGDPSTGFEPIPSNTFIEFLDYLKAAESKGSVGRALWRSGRLLPRPENRGSSAASGWNGETKFTWQVPTPFPHGVVLKVAVNGSAHIRLFQAGHELHRNKDGFYSVSFDSPELIVRGQL